MCELFVLGMSEDREHDFQGHILLHSSIMKRYLCLN